MTRESKTVREILDDPETARELRSAFKHILRERRAINESMTLREVREIFELRAIAHMTPRLRRFALSVLEAIKTECSRTQTQHPSKA